MTRKKLSIWLKFMIIGVGVCGFTVYALILPGLLNEIFGVGSASTAWLIFLCVTGLPCYAVLVISWMISSNIGRDNSFCRANARLLAAISALAAADSAFLFIGSTVFFFLKMTNPTVTAVSLIVTFAGIALAVAFASLSHLVTRAAELQEQSDLTI